MIEGVRGEDGGRLNVLRRNFRSERTLLPQDKGFFFFFFTEVVIVTKVFEKDLKWCGNSSLCRQRRETLIRSETLTELVFFFLDYFHCNVLKILIQYFPIYRRMIDNERS